VIVDPGFAPPLSFVEKAKRFLETACASFIFEMRSHQSSLRHLDRAR
jgi:hypothetical protein